MAQKVADCCSVTQSCLTLSHPVDCSTPGFPVLPYLPSLLRLMSIESVMPSNHLILFSSCPQSFPTSGSFPIMWPKYWSFSLSISPSSEYSGLISLKIDWFDLLAAQGTLKSLLQHPVDVQFSSVQSLSHVRLFATPRTAARHTSLSITNSQSLLKLMSIELVMPSNQSLDLPSFPASGSFPMSQFLTSGGQSTGASASASDLPMNIQD